MNISTFDELLQAAREQPDAQRLLLVFVQAGIAADCSAEQRASFESGQGGELTPLMCVDKTPQELSSFAALKAESQQVGPPWSLVFASTLSGQGHQAPSSEQAQTLLEGMVQAIKDGRLDAFIPFDQDGCAVSLQAAPPR